MILRAGLEPPAGALKSLETRRTMRFSIITPSFRNGPWLKLCLASVADQGVAVEHIVQDAGSDDGTLDWLPSDPRVRAFVEPDGGMYDAINRGLGRAAGDIAAWLNCDEQYLPGALQTVREFFTAHPDVDVVFGDIIMVDADGNYLCHRKVQPPLLGHTWTCHLSTLSCAMFFRRKLVAPLAGFRFDTSYRAGSDGEWMVRLLRAGVRMAALRQFTSVFTQTGANLGRQAEAEAERRRLRDTAPAWMRVLSPAFVLQHRLRRLLDGSYTQAPFSFSLYTLGSEERRVLREVPRPTYRCPNPAP
jgi:glycosyltransferase involved in cell wall biosynthesis